MKSNCAVVNAGIVSTGKIQTRFVTYGGPDMFHQFLVWLASTVGRLGYPGIVMLMVLESSFFPFPSEVVIPPAAYLAASGKMNIGMVILCGEL